MKRAFALLLALLLILAGCSGEEKMNDVSVKDVSCPYQISHKKGAVLLTLSDGAQSGILWDVETIPADICQVAEETIEKEYTSQYQITGIEEGTAKLTFTAVRPDEVASFVLTLLVNVDAQGNTVVSSYQHQQREDTSVSENGLNYKWNIDVDGILNFSFINSDDGWSVKGEGQGVCILSNMMSTPSGCRFSAEPIGQGKITMVLTGETTQRTVHVVVQVDDTGKAEIVSVQEQ